MHENADCTVVNVATDTDNFTISLVIEIDITDTQIE